MLVPFTDPLFQAMQPDDKYKFGVEAYLVGPNGSTLPVLSEQHVYCYVGDYVDLEPFNPDWEVAWALDADDLDFPTWRDLALGTYVEEVYNDPQNPPGQLMNRYIGLHIAVRKLPKSLATPPSAPDSPTQLNNGQVR